MDGEAEIVFDAGEYDEELAMHVLEDSDKCLRLEGNLGTFVNGLAEKMSMDEFCKRFERENGVTTSYVVLKGEATAYYVAEEYAVINFDGDGDGIAEAALEIALDEGEEIGPESDTWVYWEALTLVD